MDGAQNRTVTLIISTVFRSELLEHRSLCKCDPLSTDELQHHLKHELRSLNCVQTSLTQSFCAPRSVPHPLLQSHPKTLPSSERLFVPHLLKKPARCPAPSSPPTAWPREGPGSVLSPELCRSVSRADCIFSLLLLPTVLGGLSLGLRKGGSGYLQIPGKAGNGVCRGLLHRLCT